jgi:hypothetical protein
LRTRKRNGLDFNLEAVTQFRHRCESQNDDERSDEAPAFADRRGERVIAARKDSRYS